MGDVRPERRQAVYDREERPEQHLVETSGWLFRELSKLVPQRGRVRVRIVLEVEPE